MVICLPPLQDTFGTGALGPRELLVLLTFPIVVWARTSCAAGWLRRRRLKR
jgi:hypothetical protein